MELNKRMQSLLDRRKQNQAFRSVQNNKHLVDFCSNDYLSLARSSILKEKVHKKSAELSLGSTGSRLLSGHYNLISTLEKKTANFHQAEASLLFNSGYTANLSILSTVPRRSDLILYDERVHASIHDGIKLSAANSITFPHNDINALEALLKKHSKQTIFVVVESIYSMDGDAGELKKISQLCKSENAHLIVDEAHSTGIYGPNGAGLCVELGIEKDVFARLYTFGKGIGAHGAVIVGSTTLKEYLFNYARPLIYTTALSPHSVLTVLEAYCHLEEHGTEYIKELRERILYFRELVKPLAKNYYIESFSPIQSIIIPGNDKVVELSNKLQRAGFDARPIRMPTIPAGKERIRICLHRHNSFDEIKELVSLLL